VQPGGGPGFPDVAVDKLGRSIFVWNGTPAGTREEVFLRIFPADGSSPTDPVQVNTFVEFPQREARVAVSDDGSFLVIWQSNEPENPGDASRKVVHSQAFDANANPVGNEQLLSTLAPRVATGGIYADVAALLNGGYIVVWRSSQTSEPEDSSWTIQGRRIDANGEPLAAQFQVNSLMTSLGENYPAVTELADGGFLVVWTGPQVHGRQFTADGTPFGDDFQINTLIAGVERFTDVVLHEDGRVLVIWEDEEESGDNGSEIRARLLSPGLIAQGMDFRINTLITGDQKTPRAADYGQGGFFVVWQSAVSAGDDNAPPGIEGRIVNGSDQFTGPEFQVNNWIEGKQQSPGIGGKNGRVAVGWSSQSNPETSANVINGQFWSICGIFCDGFE
jgi:hypothetical protein